MKKKILETLKRKTKTARLPTHPSFHPTQKAWLTPQIETPPVNPRICEVYIDLCKICDLQQD